MLGMFSNDQSNLQLSQQVDLEMMSFAASQWTDLCALKTSQGCSSPGREQRVMALEFSGTENPAEGFKGIIGDKRFSIRSSRQQLSEWKVSQRPAVNPPFFIAVYKHVFLTKHRLRLSVAQFLIPARVISHLLTFCWDGRLTHRLNFKILWSFLHVLVYTKVCIYFL